MWLCCRLSTLSPYGMGRVEGLCVVGVGSARGHSPPTHHTATFPRFPFLPFPLCAWASPSLCAYPYPGCRRHPYRRRLLLLLGGDVVRHHVVLANHNNHVTRITRHHSDTGHRIGDGGMGARSNAPIAFRFCLGVRRGHLVVWDRVPISASRLSHFAARPRSQVH